MTALLLLTAIAGPGLGAMRQQFMTPAGPLIVEQLDDLPLGNEFAVTLGGELVLRTGEGNAAFADFPAPEVIRYVGERIGSFDAVAVFQQSNWGNACNGGPIWFLGIHRDQSFERSTPIDACGSKPAVVTVDPGVIHVTLPRPDQASSEEWNFSQRGLERVR